MLQEKHHRGRNTFYLYAFFQKLAKVNGILYWNAYEGGNTVKENKDEALKFKSQGRFISTQAQCGKLRGTGLH